MLRPAEFEPAPKPAIDDIFTCNISSLGRHDNRHTHAFGWSSPSAARSPIGLITCAHRPIGAQEVLGVVGPESSLGRKIVKFMPLSAARITSNANTIAREPSPIPQSARRQCMSVERQMQTPGSGPRAELPPPLKGDCLAHPGANRAQRGARLAINWYSA